MSVFLFSMEMSKHQLHGAIVINESLVNKSLRTRLYKRQPGEEHMNRCNCNERDDGATHKIYTTVRIEHEIFYGEDINFLTSSIKVFGNSI